VLYRHVEDEIDWFSKVMENKTQIIHLICILVSSILILFYLGLMPRNIESYNLGRRGIKGKCVISVLRNHGDGEIKAYLGICSIFSSSFCLSLYRIVVA
jgi:hypothetical protein